MNDDTHRFPVPNPTAGVCAWCGERAVSAKTGKLVKYCSDKCKERFKWNRRYWRNHGGNPESANRCCLNCGDRLHFQRGAKMYCSKPECRAVVRRLRLERAPRCSVDGCSKGAGTQGMCESHYSKWWRSENVDRYRRRRQVEDHRRRAVKAGAFVEDVDRLVVMERDGWRCHLCGGQIPKNAVWPDLMYPTIDHIVPLSEGGEHSYANVAAAHFSCNAAKSNRGGGEQLALI